jgi:hypothetical protein
MAELEVAQAEMRERQLYGDAPASAKGKAGRKPVGIARTAEVRDKVAEWKLTPPEKRQAPTIRKLAAQLGVSKSTVEYHLERAPDGLTELMQAAESDELRGRHPNILNVLGNLAEACDIDAIRVYLKELAGPHRAQTKAQPPVIDNRLQIAIQNLIQPAAIPSRENQALVAPDEVQSN